MTYLAIKIEGDYPKNCGGCPLGATDLDCYVSWCTVLDKEIKNYSKRLRGCPIKGTVRKRDIIPPKVVSTEGKGNT